VTPDSIKQGSKHGSAKRDDAQAGGNPFFSLILVSPYAGLLRRGPSCWLRSKGPLRTPTSGWLRFSSQVASETRGEGGKAE